MQYVTQILLVLSVTELFPLRSNFVFSARIKSESNIPLCNFCHFLLHRGENCCHLMPPNHICFCLLLSHLLCSGHTGLLTLPTLPTQTSTSFRIKTVTTLSVKTFQAELDVSVALCFHVEHNYGFICPWFHSSWFTGVNSRSLDKGKTETRRFRLR